MQMSRKELWEWVEREASRCPLTTEQVWEWFNNECKKLGYVKENC